MHLSRLTELRLRILMYLTYENRSTLVTVPEIADRFQWSRNNIVKLTQFLTQKGWVASHRGRAGGLRLAKPASEYRLGDLVRELENDRSAEPCGEPVCKILNASQLCEAGEQSFEAFYERLNQETLESICRSEETAKTLLALHEKDGAAETGRRGERTGSMLMKPRSIFELRAMRKAAEAKMKQARKKRAPKKEE